MAIVFSSHDVGRW
jgi:hypothetical protein